MLGIVSLAYVWTFGIDSSLSRVIRLDLIHNRRVVNSNRHDAMRDAE
jgi:hypothetical protein